MWRYNNLLRRRVTFILDLRSMVVATLVTAGSVDEDCILRVHVDHQHCNDEIERVLS